MIHPKFQLEKSLRNFYGLQKFQTNHSQLSLLTSGAIISVFEASAKRSIKIKSSLWKPLSAKKKFLFHFIHYPSKTHLSSVKHNSFGTSHFNSLCSLEYFVDHFFLFPHSNDFFFQLENCEDKDLKLSEG